MSDERIVRDLRASVTATFDDATALLRHVSTNLTGIEGLLQAYSGLFAEMQAGHRVKGVDLSKRRTATLEAVQRIRDLRMAVDANADEIAAAVKQFNESAAAQDEAR